MSRFQGLKEALAQPAERQGEAVHQWGKQKTCEWRDGFPDHEDGGGPYKTRTLYTHPAPAQQNPAPGYCKHCKEYTIEAPLPAEPLSEDAVREIVTDWIDESDTHIRYGISLARAIEAAHGIRGEK